MAFKFKKILLAAAGLGSLLVFQTVYAANLNDAFKVDDTGVSDRLDSVSNKAGYNISGGSNAVTVEGLVNSGVKALFSLLGVLFVSLIIYGGVLWMNAGGNEKQVEKGKDIIVQSLIGLGVVVGAAAITYFIFSSGLFYTTTDGSGTSPL